jgi:hypothetical protein
MLTTLRSQRAANLVVPGAGATEQFTSLLFIGDAFA